MKSSRMFRFVLLLLTGGMVFQASASCASQVVDTFVSALTPAVTSALTDAITSGLQGATGT